MCTKGHRLGVLRVEGLHQRSPQQPTRPELGDFHKMVHSDSPKKGDPGRKRVHVQPGTNSFTHVFHSIGQRVSQLQIGCCAGFVHVITAHTNGVETRHSLRRVPEDVADQFHGGFGWIDVRIPHHELFENIVLDGSRELFGWHTLLLSGYNVKGHHGDHRAIHGHGHRHGIQRDLIKKDLHVLDGVDRHAGLSYIAGDPRMVGIVPAVCG